MNQKIATIGNELKQSLYKFTAVNFLGLGEYDENLNYDVVLPEVIKKHFCGKSASSGVINLTKNPSDLVPDMKNKPVAKPIASNNSGRSNNPKKHLHKYKIKYF